MPAHILIYSLLLSVVAHENCEWPFAQNRSSPVSICRSFLVMQQLIKVSVFNQRGFRFSSPHRYSLVFGREKILEMRHLTPERRIKALRSLSLFRVFIIYFKRFIFNSKKFLETFFFVSCTALKIFLSISIIQ